MYCPFCSAFDTRVIDSRLVADGGQVRRRRECAECNERFTTYELAELVMPRVIKSDGTREPFNDEKLRAGLARALEKRPVAVERIEGAVAQIQNFLRGNRRSCYEAIKRFGRGRLCEVRFRLSQFSGH